MDSTTFPAADAIDRCIASICALVRAVVGHGAADPESLHGPDHWKAVAANGAGLLMETRGADPSVVLLFALFHDAMRRPRGETPLVHGSGHCRHGHRGAALARRLNGEVFTLSPDRLDLLCAACELHNGAPPTSHPTLGVCWDSDRLDLWRCGVRPDPRRLSTIAAREPFRLLAAREPRTAPSWRELMRRYRDIEPIVTDPDRGGRQSRGRDEE